MGFWNSIKNFKQDIDKLENTILYTNDTIRKVYERNAILEKEVENRNKELDTISKQMVTMQNIVNMMNSSKPLSNVLNAVVSNLQDELGYLHSCIVKKISDGNSEYLQVLACTKELVNDFEAYFKKELFEVKLNYDTVIEKYLDNGSGIYHSADYARLLKTAFPNITDEIIANTIEKSNVRSYILVPLDYKNKKFGSLLVFSPREVTSQSELGFLELFAKQIELAVTIADLFQAVKEQAITDGMTGLYNRRYFEEFIQNEAKRSNRQQQCFTVIGIDLDHLKEINDKYGHSYGDIAIKAVADVLKNSGRSIDIAARMGGEEFNIILPGIDSQGGLVVAERIRKSIESVIIDKVGNITASLGVGTFMENSSDVDELLELVDQAMYESKRNGRNRVTLAKPLNEASWQELAVDIFVDIISKHRLPLDKSTSNLLTKKLEELNFNSDMLFQISDTLVSTYNPSHTSGNTKKKVLLATSIAKRFDLPKENIDKLKIATLLYDIGNTMLPKGILNKKEPLTEEDKAFIKQHPIIAARDILKPISNIVDIIPIIEKHHENWNGTGYPSNISGSAIPLESQIILIVDEYFALTEERPYRDALSKEQAVKTILTEANSKWSEKLALEFSMIVENDMNE